MIPKIKLITAKPNYGLDVVFEDGAHVLYNVAEDIAQIKQFAPLEKEFGLFENFQVDKSRTCVYWSDEIDLPSDTIYEYGQSI